MLIRRRDAQELFEIFVEEVLEELFVKIFGKYEKMVVASCPEFGRQ